MSKTIYKILLFLKRRPGMTMEAFEAYYEDNHAPLAVRSMSGGVNRYFRRYLTPYPNPETGETGELPYDVVTEVWYDDEAVFQRALTYLTTSIMTDEIVEDEKKLFDRPKIRIATAVERESILPG